MIENLEIKNIRNLKNLNLSFNKNIVIFLGENGVGKTTILESIYLCSKTKSHRSKEIEMISFNEIFGKISLKRKQLYKIVLTKESKKVFINNVSVKKISDYVGKLRTVMFSTEDLYLVFGSPNIRRNFLDIEICQLDKEYLESLNRYKKILKQRQELLKNMQIDDDLTFLKIITKQLIFESKIIINKRSEFIKNININISLIKENEKLEIKYLPCIPVKDLESVYQKKEQQDILTKTTNYGINRDELGFYINEKEAKYYSQGQIRSLVLEIKLALVKYIQAKTNETPVILLDDVLSELDSLRQNILFQLFNDEHEIFISTTDISKINQEILKKAQIFFLDKEGIQAYAK